MNDALTLGIYTTAFLGLLTAVGAVMDPGGLWDRLCVWLGLDDVDPDDLIIRDLRLERPSRCCPGCGDAV